jgi:hypothetical protein
MSGRKTLLLISSAMLLLLASLSRFWGASNVWMFWCVPVRPPGFSDLLDVLSGIQLAGSQAGSAVNSYGLVGGYPRIWTAFQALGIGAADTVWIALAMLCAYCGGIFAFARGYGRGTAVALAAVMFSPAAMLGYERANLDLGMFAVLAAALWLASYSSFIPLVPILLAAMFKIYPIVALGYLLKQPRRSFLIGAGVTLALFILYMVWIGSHAIQGMTAIPKGDLFAYGVSVVAIYAYRVGVARLQGSLIILGSYLLLYLLILLALYLSYRLHAHEKLDALPSNYLDAFRVGALIYIGTFFLGNSFNYRLVFLMFCIPQIVVWSRPDSPASREARFTLVALLASCWAIMLLRFTPEGFVLAVEELCRWALLGGLMYLFLVSTPDWIFSEVEQFFKRRERGRRVLTPEPEPYFPQGFGIAVIAAPAIPRPCAVRLVSPA